MEKASKKAESIADQAQADAHETVKTQLSKISKAIDDLETSEFSCNLKIRLLQKFNKLPTKIQGLLDGAGEGLKDAGKKVASNAYKPGISGGLKLSNFSGSTIHETVIKVGHFFGHKFKPWEAIKWTKGVAIAGHALAAFGVVFSVGMQMKSDIDEDKHTQQMKDNRHNIRSAFNAVANELEKFANLYSNDVISQAIEPSISELDKNIAEIRDTRKNRTQEYIQLQTVQQDCISLIQEIHSAK